MNSGGCRSSRASSDLVGVPLIWLAWRDRPFGPPKMLDYETIRVVWGKTESR